MPNPIDGFYAAYLSGTSGQGFALLECKKGIIVGADASGGVFDGEYTADTEDAYRVIIKTKVPPNTSLIQGGVSGPEGETREQSFMLPADFFRREFVRLETTHGPINAKLVRIREIVD
jgi:hypothetical protein